MNQQVQESKTSGMAIAALVMSVLFCVPFFPMIGCVLGVIALVNINKSGGRIRGQGLAIAAIALGGLMIVANIGMLAAIAVPNFIRYQLRSKEREVTISLASIGNEARSYSERMRGAGGKAHFPPGTTPFTPAAICPVQGCTLDPGQWAGSPWSDLAFSPPAPKHRFQYQYSSPDPEHETFEVTARADLDGNGTPSQWKLTGRISGGVAEIAEPMNLAPGEY